MPVASNEFLKSNKQMPSILIIGHGYIGSQLGSELADAGYRVAALNRSSEESSRYPILTGDLGDADSLARAGENFEGEIDFIVHCASSGRGGAEAYRTVFVEGVKNLQGIFPEVPIILTSSSSVYGQTDGSVVTEDSETSPDRETSQLLCEAERLVSDGGGVALRLAGIYGPGRSVHLKKMLEGTATIESGEVSRFLNQIHRDDAVGAIRHVIDNFSALGEQRIFNVSDDTPVTQRECYEQLAEFFDLPIPPEAPPDMNRKRAWTNKIVSNEALRSTGWRLIYPSFIGALSSDPALVPSIREQI